MKPDIILVSHKSENSTKVCDFLRYSKIDVLHVRNTHDAKAGLTLSALLLLNSDMSGIDCILSEIAHMIILTHYLTLCSPQLFNWYRMFNAVQTKC